MNANEREGRIPICDHSRSFAAVLLAVFAATGCTRSVNRTAERRIRDALPRYVGPARAWRAHVENPPERTLRGRLSRVTIDGEGVRLASEITCDSLHMELRDVEVDTGSNRVKAVRETEFTAVIGEAALNDYVRATPPPPEEPVRIQRVRLMNGRIHSEATRWLLGHAWPFTVTAEPRLSSTTHLEFDPDRMTVLGLTVPLPTSVLRWFARRLDQGFDFSTLPFPVRIDRFTVSRGQITLSGKADLMQFLRERVAVAMSPSPG